MFALQLTVQVNVFCEDDKEVTISFGTLGLFWGVLLLILFYFVGAFYVCIAAASRSIIRAYSSFRLAEQNIQKEIVPRRVDLREGGG